MRSLFVTGTDTDVGKTFVAAGILRNLVQSGINAVPAKPVQTGCVNDLAEDLEFSLNTAGLQFSDLVREKLCPLRFVPACSPHLAAELCGQTIDVNRMAADLTALTGQFECVIAEGAGGIFVPLGGGKTMLDLMTILKWPVLLVSSDKLGTINHTLLSLNALKQAGIKIAGVAVNHVSPASELISASNTETVRVYGKVEILGNIPFSPDIFPEDSFYEICKKLKGILADELPGN